MHLVLYFLDKCINDVTVFLFFIMNIDTWKYNSLSVYFDFCMRI